jgi:hypothetical protein
LSAVDGHGDLVGFIVEGTGKLGGALFSIGKKTFGKDSEVATLVKSMQSSGLDR